MLIQIYGTGCKHCQLLEQHVFTALERLHLEAKVEKVTDLIAIANRGVLRTPGLVINDQLVSQGKVLAPVEIMAFLRRSLP